MIFEQEVLPAAFSDNASGELDPVKNELRVPKCCVVILQKTADCYVTRAALVTPPSHPWTTSAMIVCTR